MAWSICWRASAMLALGQRVSSASMVERRREKIGGRAEFITLRCALRRHRSRRGASAAAGGGGARPRRARRRSRLRRACGRGPVSSASLSPSSAASIVWSVSDAGRIADDRRDIGERDDLAVAGIEKELFELAADGEAVAAEIFRQKHRAPPARSSTPASSAAAADERVEARAFDLIGRKRDRALRRLERLSERVRRRSARRPRRHPRRVGRPVEERLQRADDVVAAVEDAKRDHRLAAEERGGIRLVGDAAGIGGELVGADAEHRLAAAALQRELLERAGALGDRAGIAAVDEEEPNAFRRRLGRKRSTSCALRATMLGASAWRNRRRGAPASARPAPWPADPPRRGAARMLAKFCEERV